MPRLSRGRLVLSIALLVVVSLATARAAIPSPQIDEPIASAPGREVVVFAGGCFWGIQAVFEHVKGVVQATAGYSGGSASTAHYEIVSTGTTGHAESVRVVYDPSKVSIGTLAEVFFAVAHDPTELNFQGPDYGTQYRSVVFYTTPMQQRVVEAYIHQLTQARTFAHPIVTQVVPLTAFYPAEDYHQDYAANNPTDAYIMINDAPKLAHLQVAYPALYVKKAAGY